METNPCHVQFRPSSPLRSTQMHPEERLTPLSKRHRVEGANQMLFTQMDNQQYVFHQCNRQLPPKNTLPLLFDSPVFIMWGRTMRLGCMTGKNLLSTVLSLSGWQLIKRKKESTLRFMSTDVCALA